MIVFIKFKYEGAKNQIVSKLQSPQGMLWSEYGVQVCSHNLDSNVKLIRVLGITTAEDIKETFSQVGGHRRCGELKEGLT